MILFTCLCIPVHQKSPLLWLAVITDVVMEVDSEAGLKPGARLVVNIIESPPVPESQHDHDMEELIGGKMYALSLLVSHREMDYSK